VTSSTSVIFVQVPALNDLLAEPDALVPPDQTVLARRVLDDGSTVIQLTYEHAGEPWWQAHWTRRYDDAQMIVVVAQVRLAHAEQIGITATEVTASLA
jgi:hypothetical protein